MIIFQKFDKYKNCIEEAHGDVGFLNFPKEQRNMKSLLSIHNIKLIHRDEQDGPAWINRHPVMPPHKQKQSNFKAGDLIFERYYRHGILHREAGPALIDYTHQSYLDKIIVKKEHFYKNNFHQNDDGPTSIYYFNNGEILYFYSINNTRVSTSVKLNSKEEIQNFSILQ